MSRAEREGDARGYQNPAWFEETVRFRGNVAARRLLSF